MGRFLPVSEAAAVAGVHFTTAFRIIREDHVETRIGPGSRRGKKRRLLVDPASLRARSVKFRGLPDLAAWEDRFRRMIEAEMGQAVADARRELLRSKKGTRLAAGPSPRWPRRSQGT